MTETTTGALLRRPVRAAPALPLRTRLSGRAVGVLLLLEAIAVAWSVLVLAARAIAAAGLDGTASNGVLSRTAVIVAAIVLAGALASTAEALWCARLARGRFALHVVRLWAAVLVVAVHVVATLGAASRESWGVALVAALVAAATVAVWARQSAPHA